MINLLPGGMELDRVFLTAVEFFNRSLTGGRATAVSGLGTFRTTGFASKDLRRSRTGFEKNGSFLRVSIFTLIYVSV